MRRLLLALPALMLTLPATAQPANVNPEVDKLLVCATVFSIHSDDLRTQGDEGGAIEFSNRSNELGERASGILASEGASGEDIQNTMMNYALMTGFEVGAGAARFSLEDCFALVE